MCNCQSKTVYYSLHIWHLNLYLIILLVAIYVVTHVSKVSIEQNEILPDLRKPVALKYEALSLHINPASAESVDSGFSLLLPYSEYN